LIPQSIGNLRQLKFLYLGGNGLSGPIPQSISNMSLLEEVNLSSNYFSGTFNSGIMLHICDISLFTSFFFYFDKISLFTIINCNF
jgi:Leucine-rich repeat (LRR) protein